MKLVKTVTRIYLYPFSS